MYIVVCILVGHELNIKLVGNNENNSSLCISYRQAKSACFYIGFRLIQLYIPSLPTLQSESVKPTFSSYASGMMLLK